MSVMLPIELTVQFYALKNLKDRKHLSNVGPVDDTSGVWECSGLTPLALKAWA